MERGDKMLTLLKIGDMPLKKIRDYSFSITKVDGGGGGITENGDEILDYRSIEKAVISVTFANLTMAEYTELMNLLTVKTLDLTYWRGFYKTVTVKVGNLECELLKSASFPNTDKKNYWNVSTTFTQIRSG